MKDPKNPDKFAELARKWLDGTATPAERKEYDDWFAEFGDDGLVIPKDRATNDEELRNRLFAKVVERIRAERKVRPIWRPIAVAASVLIAVLAGAVFYLKTGTHSDTPLVQNTDNGEIYFAGAKATLELADGSTVELNQIADGTELNQGSAVLSKYAEKVVYRKKGGENSEGAYNVIRVPRGGQYQVQLPDGTEVWLNSASSLRFPVAFNETVREVELTGEAYFEVAKGKNVSGTQSFQVHVNQKQTVEVLGTHFNVMAYTQETSVRTTLLEGSVRVSKYGHADGVKLKPLQQSEFLNDEFKVKSGVDPVEVVSWKEGVIRYTDADIQTIMRQIERWYDVEVSYEGKVPERNFTGGISRTSSLSQILQILEINDIHVRRDGRRLIVLPENLPNQKKMS